MKEECYPFIVKDHQRDIELRYIAARNEMYKMEQARVEWDDEWYEKTLILSENLDEIKRYMSGSSPVVYIPARLYQLAIDTVTWANDARLYKNKKRG